MKRKCHNCGKPIAFQLVCSHCGNDYCEECRLPETHNCTSFNRKTATPLWKKLQ